MIYSFTKEDFDSLKKVSELNKQYFHYPNGYSPKKKLEEARKIQKPVLLKLKSVKNDLEKETYYQQRFSIKISNSRSISNKVAQGSIRPNIWLSLVDLNEFRKSENNKEKYIHQQLPQLQITINKDFLTSASVYLEAYYTDSALREKFIRYLLTKRLQEDYLFTAYDKKIDKLVFKQKLNRIKKAELSKYVERHFCIAIEFRYDENVFTNTSVNLGNLIRSDVQRIYNEVYSNCFGFKPITKSFSKKEHRNTRKSRTEDFNTDISFRKASNSVKVEKTHRKIQNALKVFLEDKYKSKKLKAVFESDYVDLRLDINDQQRVVLYEIKTADKAKDCIKQGLGQLLYYYTVLKAKEKLPDDVELVIVGKSKLESDGINLVKELKGFLGKKTFRYQQFDLKKNVLVDARNS